MIKEKQEEKIAPAQPKTQQQIYSEKFEKKLKTKRMFLAVLAVVLAVACGVWYFTRSKAEKVVLSCWSSYHWYWKLDSVSQNPDTGRIDVRFQYRKYDSREREKWLKSLEKPYRKLTEKFPENVVNVHYNYGYDALLTFNQNDGLNINSNQKMETVSLKELTGLFPETKRLCLAGNYGNIEEIEGFENLQCICVTWGVTREEQQKINELFPECEILDSPYDLIMDYFY